MSIQTPKPRREYRPTTSELFEGAAMIVMLTSTFALLGIVLAEVLG